jgi:hypothetical protein
VSGAELRRRRDDLALQLTGLVHVRALLESHGAALEAVALHSEAIDRVRAELERLGAHANGFARGNA